MMSVVSEWTEQTSATYVDLADIAVPRRNEIVRTLVEAVPFPREQPLRIVELGAGEGQLAEALLDAFPAATLLALDGSESMRRAATERTTRFSGRAVVRGFKLETLDWWDVMFGADLVVSSLCLHHLNDAKKQYVYKAAADRLSERGAFLVADLVEPVHPAARRVAADAWDVAAREQALGMGRPELADRFVESQWNHLRFPDAADRPAALLHHLIWLKHAGFAAAECLWLFAAHAVFGGFKRKD
jgi:tRNA (cmo5U34)-methyltransferase